jgi:hypothetical protein
MHPPSCRHTWCFGGSWGRESIPLHVALVFAPLACSLPPTVHRRCRRNPTTRPALPKLMIFRWLELRPDSHTPAAAAAGAGSEGGQLSATSSDAGSPEAPAWPRERMCATLTPTRDGRMLLLGGRWRDGVCDDAWWLQPVGFHDSCIALRSKSEPCCRCVAGVAAGLGGAKQVWARLLIAQSTLDNSINMVSPPPPAPTHPCIPPPRTASGSAGHERQCSGGARRQQYRDIGPCGAGRRREVSSGSRAAHCCTLRAAACRSCCF